MLVPFELNSFLFIYIQILILVTGIVLDFREQIREGQKKILKGVRFNKRFELQMAKRGINL